MGEFVRESLTLSDLQRINHEGTHTQFHNLPVFSEDYHVDTIRTSSIDFSKKIGRGYQGFVCLLKDSVDKVVKLLKLKRRNEVSTNEIIISVSSVYASNIGVGPTIHGAPFITTEGDYIAIIMDKVSMYRPTEGDVQEIILLFEKMIENQFMTFDMEYGKTSSGQIVIVDFGVSGFYPSKYEALQSAVQNDLFANTGLGYYHKTLEDHFTQKMLQMGSTKGGKKKKTIRKGRKKRKTYRKRPRKLF